MVWQRRRSAGDAACRPACAARTDQPTGMLPVPNTVIRKCNPPLKRMSSTRRSTHTYGTREPHHKGSHTAWQRFSGRWFARRQVILVAAGSRKDRYHGPMHDLLIVGRRAVRDARTLEVSDRTFV